MTVHDVSYKLWVINGKMMMVHNSQLVKVNWCFLNNHSLTAKNGDYWLMILAVNG